MMLSLGYLEIPSIALLESGIGNRSEGIVDCKRVFLGHAAQTGFINVLTLICSAISIVGVGATAFFNG